MSHEQAVADYREATKHAEPTCVANVHQWGRIIRLLEPNTERDGSICAGGTLWPMQACERCGVVRMVPE